MGAILSRHQVPFVATEKLDGFSFSFGRIDGEFVASAREREIDIDGDCVFAQAVRQFSLGTLNIPDNCIFQGELIGPGIRGNRYNRTILGIFIFDVLLDGVYLNHEGAKELAERHGFEMVPVIAKGFNPGVYPFAELAIGQSAINPGVQIEGAVFRPMRERRDYFQGRVSFKVFNPLYPFHH
jgi:hypothetical protein